MKIRLASLSWSVSLYLNSGVSRTAGGDAGDHQAAGGGPVSGPTPQWSVWSWAQRLQANEWGTQKESCGVPAENPKGMIMPVNLTRARLCTFSLCKISGTKSFVVFFHGLQKWRLDKALQLWKVLFYAAMLSLYLFISFLPIFISGKRTRQSRGGGATLQIRKGSTISRGFLGCFLYML